MLSGTLFIPVPGGGQSITTSGTSAEATNPAPAGIRAVSVYATEDAYVRFSPTGGAATTADYFMAGGTKEYLACPDGTYVQAIQASTGGTVRIHWLIGR